MAHVHAEKATPKTVTPAIKTSEAPAFFSDMNQAATTAANADAANARQIANSRVTRTYSITVLHQDSLANNLGRIRTRPDNLTHSGILSWNSLRSPATIERPACSVVGVAGGTQHDALRVVAHLGGEGVQCLRSYKKRAPILGTLFDCSAAPSGLLSRRSHSSSNPFMIRLFISSSWPSMHLA